MTDMLALMTIIFWPVIPLFWIPVHFSPAFFRRIGLFTYGMPLITWVPVAYLIYTNRSFLLQAKVTLFSACDIIGAILLVSGISIHIWTVRLLGLWGIIGIPEIFPKMKAHIVTSGPFSVVRHPTYLAHTLLFTGVFLITDIIPVAIVAIVDFLIMNTFVIPLEENELQKRFGEEYKRYSEKVPFRLLPWIF